MWHWGTAIVPSSLVSVHTATLEGNLDNLRIKRTVSWKQRNIYVNIMFSTSVRFGNIDKQFIYWLIYLFTYLLTDVRRLTTGIRPEKCVVRRFRRCANVIECTYTNLDSTDMRRLTTEIPSEKCVVRQFRSLCERHRVYLHKPRLYRYASLNDGDTFWEMRR